MGIFCKSKGKFRLEDGKLIVNGKKVAYYETDETPNKEGKSGIVQIDGGKGLTDVKVIVKNGELCAAIRYGKSTTGHELYAFGNDVKFNKNGEGQLLYFGEDGDTALVDVKKTQGKTQEKIKILYNNTAESGEQVSGANALKVGESKLLLTKEGDEDPKLVTIVKDSNSKLYRHLGKASGIDVFRTEETTDVKIGKTTEVVRIDEKTGSVTPFVVKCLKGNKYEVISGITTSGDYVQGSGKKKVQNLQPGEWLTCKDEDDKFTVRRMSESRTNGGITSDLMIYQGEKDGKEIYYLNKPLVKNTEKGQGYEAVVVVDKDGNERIAEAKLGKNGFFIKTESNDGDNSGSEKKDVKETTSTKKKTTKGIGQSERRLSQRGRGRRRLNKPQSKNKNGGSNQSEEESTGSNYSGSESSDSDS